MASSRTFRSESFNISDETQNDWWQEQIFCILKTHGFPRTRSIYPKKNGVSKKIFDGSLVLSSKVIFSSLSSDLSFLILMIFCFLGPKWN
ncbi:hypothetical protein HanIR_Chr04g0172571 [Helianthus annuus]|nr:hypothetical protein HanIR_Chr04g0172571 [Helianthus annuus]